MWATMSALEALANAAIGLIVSWLVTWLLLGYTPAQSIGVTAMFFMLSFGRVYVIRRGFKWLSERK